MFLKKKREDASQETIFFHMHWKYNWLIFFVHFVVFIPVFQSNL